MKKSLLDTANYFDVSKHQYADLFNKKNVWEIIPEINKYVTKIIKKKSKEYKMLKNNILVGKKTVIKQGVVFEGRCIIGKNCIIGPNAYIRENVLIGDNVKIGNCVETKNSIVLDNSFISHLSYVGDSIIGSHVNVGAGVIFTNLRLDEREIVVNIKNKHINTKLKKLGSIIGDNVKVGANTVLNPGCMLEKNCIIYPLKNIKGYYSKGTIIK